MGKTAICSESLSNLTCQSIWLSKPQLISLPLIESSAYGKTDPQTTLKTHKILPEKQVVGSISFTGESPSTGILLHQDFFNSIALLFIQKYSFCHYHFIPIENDDATTYMLIYLTISYIFQKNHHCCYCKKYISLTCLFMHFSEFYGYFLIFCVCSKPGPIASLSTGGISLYSSSVNSNFVADDQTRLLLFQC